MPRRSDDPPIADVAPPEVRRFLLPSGSIEAMRGVFQEGARRHEERMLLLAGTPRGPRRVLLDTVAVPEQFALPAPWGEGLAVGESWFHEAWSMVRDAHRWPYAMVHTHGGAAGHSHADEEDPFMRHDGGVSIVVPGFGLTSLGRVRTWAVHRFDARRRVWSRLWPWRVARLFRTGIQAPVQTIDARHETALRELADVLSGDAARASAFWEAAGTALGKKWPTSRDPEQPETG